MKKTLCLIVLALSLTSCATVSQKITHTLYNNRSYAVAKEDSAITSAGEKKLDKDPALSKVVMISFDRTVLLTGTANTQADKEKAEKLVRTDSRITKIYNDISVEKPSDVLIKPNDAYLTSAVNLQMQFTKGFDGHNIKVVTNNARVYLINVRKDQAYEADQITQRVSGVKKVVNIFVDKSSP